MSQWIKTKRLELLHPSEKHFQLFKELLLNKNVTKFTFKYNNDDDLNEDMKRVMFQFNLYGYSVGSVFQQRTSVFIGRAGLTNRVYGEKEYISISCLLLPKYWGYGYGKEIVSALVDYGVNILRKELLYTVDSENVSSVRLIKSLNFHKVSEFLYNGRKLHNYIIYAR